MRISDWSSDVCSSDLADGQYRDAYEHGISLAKAEFDLQGVMRVLMFGTDDYPNAENIEALLESVIKGEITEYAFSFVLVAAHTLSEAGYPVPRSEEHTSELQSLMRISYAVFCLKKKHRQT